MKTLSLIASLAGLWLAPTPLPAQNWKLTSAPTTNWSAVACSADGRLVVAAAGAVYPTPTFAPNPGPGHIYTSKDGGLKWKATDAPLTHWTAIASSADGVKLVAVEPGNFPTPGTIHLSTDSGVTWNLAGAPGKDWSAVASSADGTKLAAATYSSGIYTSSDSGTTWTETSAPNMGSWMSLASSADGRKLAAVKWGDPVPFAVYEGGIFTSTNSGLTWTSNTVARLEWGTIASSADGSKLLAAAYSDGLGNPVPLYISKDSGVTWASNSALAGNWTGVASSADGDRLVAASIGPIYTSRDDGLTWTSNHVPYEIWDGIASSADGGKLIASVLRGGICTSQSICRPKLDLACSHGNLILSWLAPSTAFDLQQNPDPGSSRWISLPVTPVLNLTNLRWEVSFPPVSDRCSYRLARPEPVPDLHPGPGLNSGNFPWNRHR